MIDKIKGKLAKNQIPSKVDSAIHRGRVNHRQTNPERDLARRFWRGDQYSWIDEKNQIRTQATVTYLEGGGKPRHRVRQRFNFVHSIVEGRVSQATQKIPSYSVAPSTTEPQDMEAAQLSEKVALYGYDKWGLRRKTVEAVTHALVVGEAFAYPYWEPNVGPYTPGLSEDGEETRVGLGEVRVPIYSGQQVFWEPGQAYEESPWWCVESAVHIDTVKALPDYNGAPLAPDASTADNPTERDVEAEKLVLVTEYFERPTPSNPQGKRLKIANGQVICKPEKYPVCNHKGEVMDEPPFVRLSYVVDPTDDRDRGLVPLLVDPQRTINDCINKQVEWKNRCLNPQIIAPMNSLVNQPNDVPGAVVYYRPTGQQPPMWQQTPPVPRELFMMVDNALQYMRVIAADIDVQAEPDLAARTAQAAIEQSRARWAQFVVGLAEWHSQVMRRCLTLVQKHYQEPRLLSIQGTWGPDLIPSFTGADLRGQADVRVDPGTIEARSRVAITQEAMAFADRGWIDGPQAMAAINGGVADKLSQAWTLDVGRVNRIIQSIEKGNFMEAFPAHTQKTPQVDPITQQPILDPMGNPVLVDVQVPGWMPRPGVDNVALHKQVISSWMKTTAWDRLNDAQRAAGELYFETLQQIEADEMQSQMMAQNMQAEQMGAENASKPQQAKATPDQPNMDGDLPNEQLG